MKKISMIILIALLAITFFSCDDTTTDPVEENGTIYIESEPSGAEIWVDGVNSGVITPGTVEASVGNHTVTLKLEGYSDLEIPVSLSSGQEFILTTGTTLSKLGALIIESQPAGAVIFLDGVNNGEKTPHNFSVPDGNFILELRLENYNDTTHVTQVSNAGSVTVNIDLRPEFITSHKVKIYESFGTGVDEPSGVDLSSGNAFGISGEDKDNVDIYYFSNSVGTSFLVQSSHLHSNMSRETFFNLTTNKNLNDSNNSPEKNSEWIHSIDLQDSEKIDKYMFLYDADGHYSKLKVINQGGLGTSDDPAWVEVQWYYNETENDINF